MDNQERAKKLNSLIQLDIDASFAYEEALNEIQHASVRDQLSRFRNDHQRHIQELSDAVRELGEKPTDYSRDFKGFLIQGFTSLRSITGTEGALKAMQTNEQLTNKTYDQARSWDFTPRIKALIEKNYSDEQQHLHYIEQALTQRSWER